MLIRKLKNLTVSLQILMNVQREFQAVLKCAPTQWEAILAAAILDTLLMQMVPPVPEALVCYAMLVMYGHNYFIFDNFFIHSWWLCL